MRRRTLLLPVLFALITGLVVVVVWLAVERQERRSTERQLDLLARETASRLEDFVVSRLSVIDAIRRERAAGMLADEEAFVTRALIAEEEFHGFQSINWLSPDGTILWVAPEEGNLAARGRNVRDHPEAAPHFIAALRTGERSVTGPIDLFQGVKGFTSYEPVTVDGELVGFVSAVFDVADLVESCLGPGPSRDLELRLHVGESPSFYETDRFDLARRRATAESSLHFDDQTWVVVVAPRRALWGELESGHDEGLLAIGLVLSLGLGWLLHVAMKRQAVQRVLEGEREQLAELVEASVDLIGMARPDGQVFYFNQAARSLLGIERPEELTGLRISDFVSDRDRDKALAVHREILEKGTWEGELQYKQLHTGAPIDMEVRAFALRHPRTGEVTAIAASAKDLRERHRLEAELRQAQKMEAVGRLAGGVAHDFNNLLTAMLGHAEMARRRPDDAERTGEHLDEILRAARRASDLTTRLLSFSRKQVVEARPLSLAVQLEEMAGLLRRLVPEDVELRVERRGSGVIVADAAQMEQVIMNLVINAVDAMPEGGVLTIGLEDDGHDVVLRVGDTGVGMSPEVSERVFEPFFTTKEVGRGTGLGLSTVYGVVTQADGHIQVTSTEGRGTTFEIRFPRTSRRPRHSTVTSGEHPAGGRESVMIVEDDAQVRQMSVRALSEAGYEVLEAENGEHALAILDGGVGELDVLVSDLVMPRMGGLELARRVHETSPGTQLVLTSGHPDERVDTERLDSVGATFLSKPYTTRRLLEVVREALDG